MTNRAFLPPIINPLVVALVRLAEPFLLRGVYGGTTIQISDEDMEKLRQYKGKRMLLLPNHPTGGEPIILFHISRRMDEVFNYVAAREVFDWEHGFRGWVLRRCGAYSIIRGAADRESFLMSKKILMEGKHRLVIFIEGEISRENDVLIPFEAGVFQLAFWAQEALAREARKQAKHGEGEADFPAIYAAPIAIKYFYEPGVETAIEQSLQNLEQAVGITPEPEADHYRRLRTLGEAILKVQEDMHQMIALPGTTLNERLDAVKNRMLRKMELFLDLKPDPEATMLDRLRDVRNTMDRLIHVYDDPMDLTDYEKRMVEHFRLALNEFYKDLDRVVYFLTYDESYLRDNPSPEHFVEMLQRLEREVFGGIKISHPRVALVKVGEIWDLKAHFPDYEADKKSFVRQLANRMENDMMSMLSSMKRPS